MFYLVGGLWSVFHLVGGEFLVWSVVLWSVRAMVGGQLVIRSVVCGWWLVGGRFLFLRMVSCWCLNQYMVGGRWLMVGGLW